MNKAIELYKEFCDMDFCDYSDTLQSDLLFISELINSYGIQDARKILKSYL